MLMNGLCLCMSMAMHFSGPWQFILSSSTCCWNFMPFLSTYWATWVTGLQQGGSVSWGKELDYSFVPFSFHLNYSCFFFTTLTNISMPVFAKHQHFWLFFWPLGVTQYVMNCSLYSLCDLIGIYNSLLCTSHLHFSGVIKGVANLVKMRNSLV